MDDTFGTYMSLQARDLLSRSGQGVSDRLTRAGQKSGAERTEELRNAAVEFESLFINHLLKVMRESIEENSLFDGGPGKGIYTELFDQELSRILSRHGGLGIADMLLDRLDQDPTSEPGEPGEPSAPGPLGEQDSQGSHLPGKATPEPIPDFQLPVAGPISSNFGWRKDPITAHRRFHQGVDLAAPKGTKVRAASAGTVVFAGYDSSYGNTVVLKHPGGFQTRYAHLDSALVREGEVLKNDQLLGLVGSTGRSTGPHLHFEISRQGNKIDPAPASSE